MLRLIYLLFILLINTAISSAQGIEMLEPSAFPSLISSIKVNGPLDFCGEPVPLDEPEMRERLEKELLLSVWSRPQVILWIKRSGRYMPHIEKILKQNNMPTDLKYVAIVESALLPHVGSSKNAIGFWQFIKPTGLKYGLRIDRAVDERRNFFKSTQAAIRYFKKLYADFGSWTLASAAYNMGEYGLSRRIDEQKTKNYYHLYLPLETQRYIFKILAAKLILSDLKKYGFNLTRKDLYSPIAFDRVNINVDTNQDIPLQLIAEAADTYFKTIKDLNPEIRGSILPSGKQFILIPEGRSKKFHRHLQLLVSKYKAEKIVKRKKAFKRKHKIYVVKKGDYLSAIAAKFHVKLSDLLRWNRLKYNSAIHPGQRLIVKQ